MIPFGLISAAAGLVCLIVPHWRRYAFAAVVSPIAFGGCSVVGMFAIILLAVLGITTMLGLDRVDSASWGAIAVGVIAYVTPGISGAIVAVSLANRLQRWRFG